MTFADKQCLDHALKRCSCYTTLTPSAEPPSPGALVARLRERKHFRPELSALCREAADALERLARENAALRNANSSFASNAICHGSRANDLWTCPKAPCDYCLQWQTRRAERAEAERDALRTAALAMRERCAQRAESAQSNGDDCAAAIRALEIE